MKNYITGVMIVCMTVMGTFLYKASKTPVLDGFPIDWPAKKNTSGEPLFHIFIFFSRNNCPVCLESVKVLNQLQSPFIVTGIVPGNELENESEIRSTTGAAFKLVSSRDSYKKFNPHYQPSIFGVSGKGRILFILPGVPGQAEYLDNFLVEFYGKSLEILIHDSR